MPAIWTSKQPWVRRPSGLVRPNLGSPHASQLRGWWLAQPGILRDSRADSLLTATGTPQAVPSALGGFAGRFNGTSDYLGRTSAFKDLLGSAFPYSMSIWFRPSAVGVAQFLMGGVALGYMGVEINASGTVRFRGNTSGEKVVTSVGTVSAGEWNHAVAVARDSTNWFLYLNGRTDTTQYGAGSPFLYSDDLRLGYGASGTYFGGDLADCRLLARAVSPSECRELYDPRTRWELYQPVVRRSYFDMAGGGGGPTYTLDCEAGAYTLTGTDAALTVGRTIAADPGTYSLTGTDATLTVGRTLVADPGAYTVTGTDAALTVSRTIDADPGSYTVTGTTADLVVSRVLDAEAGVYTLTGTAADLTYTPLSGPTYTLAADAGTYTLTGTDAALTVSRTLDAAAGSYAVTGTDAALVIGRVITADAGSYASSGTAATLVVSRVLGADAGAYALTGTAATLTYSGAAPDLAAEADTWRARTRPTAWRAKPRRTAWKAKP